MGKKPFTLPIQGTQTVPGLIEWGNLKNKFSGITMFRARLYNLETGDLSALDIINNRWFFEELFEYSKINQDINLLPALKKIAGSVKFDEGLRQQASEVEEIIEDQANRKKNIPENVLDTIEFEKAQNARRILAGTRYPQTTEILRLLRDKSPELKRLALFLIGKFKMTDMIQEVCECLNTPGVKEDAFNVLVSFGNAAGMELERFYLTTAGNISTSKVVLRLLSKTRPSENMTFLVDRLWSSSRQIKEMALRTLINMKYIIDNIEKERLQKHIFETFGILAWIISAQVCLQNNNNTLLSSEINKEYARWKEYLLNLLILTYDKVVSLDGKSQNENKDNQEKFIPELAEIIFGNASKSKYADYTDPDYFQRKLKKLKRYFHSEVPEYKSLLEDIINCDYNLLSVWTKACAIRNINELGDANIGQSVVALLFSPEELLRQEAALLLARSGKDLYMAVCERIHDNAKNYLDRIIKGEFNDKELIYEKVNFLSTCFPGINENELLFIAEKIMTVKNDQGVTYSQPSDSLIWSFTSEKADPMVYINIGSGKDRDEVVKEPVCSLCYILPLTIVREFDFQYPESSFGIFKYIDSKEE